MKMLLFSAVLISFCLLAAAQTALPPNDPFAEPLPKPEKIYSNEIGIRYGAQIAVGRGVNYDYQQISIDYARYFYNQIGLRSGLNYTAVGIMRDHIAVPIQFSWRTGKLRSSGNIDLNTPQYRGRYDGWNYYPPAQEYTAGDLFTDILFSIIPTSFELHTGFTPGVVCRPMSQNHPTYGLYTPPQRFSATFDLGGRMIIHIWRFNLLFDITYHCYLTNTFRLSASKGKPSRSFIGLGGGLSFNL